MLDACPAVLTLSITIPLVPEVAARVLVAAAGKLPVMLKLITQPPANPPPWVQPEVTPAKSQSLSCAGLKTSVMGEHWLAVFASDRELPSVALFIVEAELKPMR